MHITDTYIHVPGVILVHPKKTVDMAEQKLLGVYTHVSF